MLNKIFKRSFATLIIAEHNGKQISKNTLKLLGAASRLKDECHVLICGENTCEVSQSIKAVAGSTVTKILKTPIKHTIAENVTNVVRKLIDQNKYQTVIGLGSSFGKDIVPRVAGYYSSQPITDIIEIIVIHQGIQDSKTFVRPTYAGNALTKVKSSQQIDFLTFRASSFEQIKVEQGNPAQQDISAVQLSKSQFIKQEKSDSNKPELTTARIVVSGGRGMKSKQNFAIINELADAFGDAAVGASRAAVDSGFCPNDLQVGQTGKVVAPELYIAIGISGAVQHLAGMKDSKVIVAINNRPDEPIFEVANYGLEGDLFKIVPELTEKIKKLKAA